MSRSYLESPDMCPAGSSKSVVDIAFEALDKRGRFSGPHRFQAQFDDLFIVYLTPFTLPPRLDLGYDIPGLRTGGYGLRISDRQGICLFVIWVKDSEDVVHFRRPMRGDWLERLYVASQSAVPLSNSERTARKPMERPQARGTR